MITNIFVTFGKKCPNCKIDGLFKDMDSENSIIYRCEECLSMFTE